MKGTTQLLSALFGSNTGILMRRLPWVRSFAGSAILLGAFAVSNRPLWLLLAMISASIGFILIVRKARGIRSVLREIPGPDASLEAQEAARQRFIPGHVAVPVKVLPTFSLFSPLWAETRRLIIQHELLPELPAEETRLRLDLSRVERIALWHTEASVKRRLNQVERAGVLAKVRKDEAAEEAVREERRKNEEESQPIYIEPAVKPSDMPVRFICQLNEPREIPLQSGGMTTMQPGIYEGFVTLTHQAPAEGSDWPESSLRCYFTIKTPDGRSLETTSILDISSLADLEKWEFCEGGIPWVNAPAEWRDAFRTSCIASHVQVCDDGRCRHPLILEGKTYVIMTKYLHFKIDMAISADHRSLIVRLHGLLSEKWTGDPFSDDDDPGEFVDFLAVPPFAACLPMESFVPLSAPDLHHMADATNPDEDEPVAYRFV
jgi:hypothetical protein